jgi:DNA-binding NarL/FixJ family response regulator
MRTEELGAMFSPGRVVTRDDRPAAVLSIVVVEGHPAVAESLGAVLKGTPGFRVARVASTGRAGIAAVADARPDVVLLDHDLPDVEIHAAIAAIRERVPSTQVVILTGSARREDVLAALDAGASGYLLKTEPPERLIAMLRSAARGEFLIGPETVAELVRQRSERRTSSDARPQRPLTSREQQVLELMAKGRDNKSIALALGLSVNTVRMHVQNVLGKLQSRSKLEAVARAAEFGLLER